ncbi:MAG: tRNA (guanosine(37)-N1)-methyltransferase TrmD [Crocinitomicaceae bacterium]|nr:tRNA (guanosine(37)-N1)-methyltransferase TrmD [Crocinitomicaceae bacterium]
MRIDILTVLPQLLEGPLKESILKRAAEKELVEIHIHNIRDFSTHSNKNVDDYQYGGGAGMVIAPQPLSDCIESLTKDRTYDEIIYMTPDGKVLDQRDCNEMSLLGNLMIICGHYKGIDHRIREMYVTREISIGSYVLTGGELAAAVTVDAIVRLIPGVINDETSALTDSFQDGLLAPPVYTRPAEFKGHKVPDVLLSGDQKKIDAWREEQALKITKEKRPDLLED